MDITGLQQKKANKQRAVELRAGAQIQTKQILVKRVLKIEQEDILSERAEKKGQNIPRNGNSLVDPSNFQEAREKPLDLKGHLPRNASTVSSSGLFLPGQRSLACLLEYLPHGQTSSELLSDLWTKDKKVERKSESVHMLERLLLVPSADPSLCAEWFLGPLQLKVVRRPESCVCITIQY
ncbi:hypothetical protein MJT46_005774 [Ovis ammon polii x Ovis aries]|nr:hypothetical protein MJT46_005774 [Ovis ammon polii x Ovis aries]